MHIFTTGTDGAGFGGLWALDGLTPKYKLNSISITPPGPEILGNVKNVHLGPQYPQNKCFP